MEPITLDPPTGETLVEGNHYVDTRTDRELLMEVLAILKRVDERSAGAELIANEVKAAFEDIKSKPMIAKMFGLG